MYTWKCPFSIRRWDSNSQPLDYGSRLLHTRPGIHSGLFAKMSKLKVNVTHCNFETLNNCGFNDCEKASFYNFVNRWHSKVFVLQKAKSFIKNLIVSKKMGQPRPLFHLFSSFQTLQFSQQIKVKISIQYMVLVFEPTNFGTCVSFRNHKTRAPALRT